MSNTKLSPAIELLKDPRTFALLLAATLVVLAIATISPALAGLEARFQHEPHAALLTRILVPAPSFVVALLSPFAGAAADHFGRVRVLLIGVTLFVLAGTAGFYLPSLLLILASRLVLGVAVAMIMTSYTALIGDCFEGDRRSLLMGWQVSARNFGGFIFISTGGALAAISPQFTFLAYGFAALFIPFIWYAFKNHDDRVPAQKTVGSDQDAGESDWLLPVLGISFFVMITVVMFFQMPTQLPFFTKSLGHDSASATAIALGALTLSGGVAALWNARLKRRLGLPGLFALGYAVMAVGFGILAFNSGLSAITVGTSIIGAGFAILMPAFADLLLQIAPAHRRGTAAGALATGAALGQFVSPFISLPIITEIGYDGAFLGSAGCLLVLCAGALIGRHMVPHTKTA